MNNLQKLLRMQQEELIKAFDRAKIEGERTPQETSDRCENALHNFLREYFPFPYQIGKGNIRDSKGRSSCSIDALIINPSHPHTVNKGRYSFIVAEGVDYAIELKPNLYNKEVKRALEQTQSVKKLRRTTDGLLSGREKLSLEQIEYQSMNNLIFFVA